MLSFLIFALAAHHAHGKYPVPKSYGGYAVPPPKDVTTEEPSPPKFTQGAPVQPPAPLPPNVADLLKSIRGTGNKVSDADMKLIKANCQLTGCKGQKTETKTRKDEQIQQLLLSGETAAQVNKQFAKTMELKQAILVQMGLGGVVEAEDDGLFGGDILLSTAQAEGMIKTLKNVTSTSTTLWDSSNPIKYAVHTDIEAHIPTINGAFQEISRQVPCLKFEFVNYIDLPSTGLSLKAPGILFRRGRNRCTSHLGQRADGVLNKIFVHGTCMFEKGLIHHILHTLGIMHSHNREDRDKYITLKYGNIVPTKLPKFAILDPANHSPFGLKYDLVSFMHFDPRDPVQTSDVQMRNTKNPIMIANPAFNVLNEYMGKAFEISPADIKLLKRMYCKAKTCKDKYPECGVLAVHGATKIKPWLTNNCKKSMALC